MKEHLRLIKKERGWDKVQFSTYRRFKYRQIQTPTVDRSEIYWEYRPKLSEMHFLPNMVTVDEIYQLMCFVLKNFIFSTHGSIAVLYRPSLQST